MEESIYNLIPKEYIPPQKEKIYKSKYPKDLAPTGSTFGNHTTSRPGVANLNGDYKQPLGPHTHKGGDKTLGKLKDKTQPKTQEFLKKTQGVQSQKEYQDQFLEQSRQQKQDRDKKEKKEKVPKVEDKPIMGLKSNKNFIIANAVQNILAAPKQQPEQFSYVNKNDYGQTPQYLTQINDNINKEYQMIRELQQQDAQEKMHEKYQLSEQERQALKAGLTKKWEAVNKEYQSITHINTIDTTGLKRKKMNCEKELSQLEKDIAKLNRGTIFVDATI